MVDKLNISKTLKRKFLDKIFLPFHLKLSTRYIICYLGPTEHNIFLINLDFVVILACHQMLRWIWCWGTQTWLYCTVRMGAQHYQLLLTRTLYSQVHNVSWGGKSYFTTVSTPILNINNNMHQSWGEIKTYVLMVFME